MNEMPRARSLAIRVRRVGSGAVEGSSSRQARIGRAQPPVRRRWSRPAARCPGRVRRPRSSAATRRRRGLRGRAGRRCRRAAIRSAMSVAGRPGPGTQRARMLGLEEQRHRLLDGGDGVADGAVVAVQGAGEQPVPEPGGVRVLAQDLGGFVRLRPGWRPTPGRARGCGRSGRRRGGSPAGPWRSRRRRSGRRCLAGRR